MSKDTRPTVEANQNPLNKVIPEGLEKFITAALSKLKNAWTYKSTLSGIQFYGDLED